MSSGFVERRVRRTAKHSTAGFASASVNDFEQQRGGCCVCRFEKAEPRNLFVVLAVVQPIADRRDAAGSPSVPARDPEIHVGVRKKRIGVRRQAAVFVAPERRNPVRMVRVQRVGQLDEFSSQSRGVDGKDLCQP
jgi:hypothetical protein